MHYALLKIYKCETIYSMNLCKIHMDHSAQANFLWMRLSSTDF